MTNTFKTLLIIPIILLVSCSSFITNNSDEEGQILLWHTWTGNEQETLKEILKSFSELYPKITIIEESYPATDIEVRFRNQVKTGLGPDILIAPANWAKQFTEQGLIQDISDLEPDLDIYLKATIDMLSDGQKIYGLPLSLNTSALYYNKNLLGPPPTTDTDKNNIVKLIQQKQAAITNTQVISTLTQILTELEQNQAGTEQFFPPTDLDMLLQQANKGHSVAISTDFYGAFWGIQTFGGQLFDDEGRVVLNQGGFANWLEWLKQAQSNSNIILNRNRDELLQLFTTGKVTYYVGSTKELPTLQELLGAETIGVIRLPGRQNNPAGPFLQAEAMMFNHVSTVQNRKLALRLAQYLTNIEQQRKLALSIGKLPTNKKVNIDPRVSPIVAEFIAQSKNAIPISLQDIDKFNTLIDYGDDLYGRVLAGEINVGEATTTLTEQINKIYGLETLTTKLESCDIASNIIIWNTRPNKVDKDAVRQIKESFTQFCPEVSVKITDIDPVKFQDLYTEAIKNEIAPHLFIGDNQQIRELAVQEQILNISDLIDAEFMQRFIPLVSQSVLYEGQVYGIPINVNVMALYYNPTLIEDPPIVLNDLLAMASSERQVAIPIGFKESYWGISAFGESSESILFDEEGRLIIGNAGLLEWLNWLKEAQNQPGIMLSTDSSALQTMFEEEKVAFLVADTLQLKSLQETLGNDKLNVVSLPSGSPLLTVDSLFITPYTTPEERDAAVKFAQFMTNPDSQMILLEQTGRVPTNININSSDYPIINSFIEQANIGTIIPNVAEVKPIFKWGDMVYEQVLKNNIEAEIAVNDFTDLVDITNGFEVSKPVFAEACTGEGQLSLWHSWAEGEQLVWQQVISDFVKLCPDIQVTTNYIATVDFTQQLTATLEADSELATPDFFISSHPLLESYQENDLIQDITPLVSKKQLVNFIPKSVTAFSSNEALYGLPQSLHLPALYYHTNLVENPAKTFEELLLQAREGITVALNNNFYPLFFGTGAFGCQPCQTGEFFDEQGELLLTQADLSDWQAWLKKADKLDNIIFSSDQATLQSLFLEGKVIYLLADSSFLNKAQEKLGIANVGITPLPQGQEEQNSTPFLQVDGFFFSKQTTEEQTKMALKFANFATSEAAQTLLMQKVNVIPTNFLTVAKADEATVAPFISEINNTILWPPQNKQVRIEESNIYHTFDIKDDLGDNKNGTK